VPRLYKADLAIQVHSHKEGSLGEEGCSGWMCLWKLEMREKNLSVILVRDNMLDMLGLFLSEKRGKKKGDGISLGPFYILV